MSRWQGYCAALGPLLVVLSMLGCGSGRVRADRDERRAQSSSGANAGSADPAKTARVTAITAKQPTQDGFWVRRFGGPEQDWARAVSTGPGGQILLLGPFGRTVSFGGTPLASTEQSSEFLASYSATGEHRWSQAVAPARLLPFSGAGEPSVLVFGAERQPAAIVTYSSTGTAASTSRLAADSGWAHHALQRADGGLLLAGSFAGQVRVRGRRLASVGGDDALVASLDARGEPGWVRQIGSSGHDIIAGLAADASGNVYVTGSFTDTLTLGPHTVRSAGMTDVFVASLSPQGEPRWLFRSGDVGYDVANDLVVDASGDTYLTGQIRRPGFYHGGRPTFYDDILLASLSSDGTERWSHRFQTTSGSGNDLVLQARSGLCLAGSFSGGVIFGSAELSAAADPALVNIPGGAESRPDAFVACFSLAGENRWARRFGGLGSDDASALAFAEDGSMVVGGAFEDSAEFEGQPLRSEGGWDVYLLSLPASRQTTAR